MIGIRVGLSCGVRVGVAAGMSADPIGGNAGDVIVFAPADSNGVGQGVGQPAGVDGEFDPVFNVMTPIAAVPYNKHYATNSNDPVAYQTDVTGGVGPYAAAGQTNSGIQVPFAQELVRSGFQSSLYEHAISGIKAAQFAPGANFPTLPNGTPDLWAATTARVDGLGGRVRGMVWSIGGNDGFSSTDANNLQANLTATANAAIAKWGSSLPIVIIRNPAFQSTAGAVPFLSTIQTAEDAFAATFSANVAAVFTDDLTGHSDHLHFDGNSYTILGQRCAYALLDKMGIARVRPATFPQVMGWGPLYTSAAGAFSVIGPGCAIAKDLEVMTVFSQTASGANNAIGTPTSAGAQPWTPRGTALSTDGTSTTRMAIFSRPVTAADLVTGLGATPASTVPSNSNPINGARIFTVRSPNTSSTPGVDVIQTSVNNAFQTGLTLSGATTTAANELILAVGGGYRTNVNANPVTMSFVNPTNPTNQFGSNRTVAVDFITHALWTGQLAAAGATGNVTASFALATLACGAVIAIKP